MIRAFEATFITRAAETKKEKLKRFLSFIVGNQPITDKGVWVIHFLYDSDLTTICPVTYGQNIAREYNDVLMRRGREIIISSMIYKEIRIEDLDRRRMFPADREQRCLLRKVERIMRERKSK